MVFHNFSFAFSKYSIFLSLLLCLIQSHMFIIFSSHLADFSKHIFPTCVYLTYLSFKPQFSFCISPPCFFSHTMSEEEREKEREVVIEEGGEDRKRKMETDRQTDSSA